MDTGRTHRSRLLVVIALLVVACGGPPASGSPEATPTPDATPEPSAAPSPTDATALVGEWERVQRCDEIVARLRDADLESWVLEFAWPFLPGATAAADIADPADPCAETVPLRHSHFFTEDGGFGSRDQVGHEVDYGTYEHRAEGTIQIGTVPFTYAIDGETITFEPAIPSCRPACFEAPWSVSVAYAGLPWHRVDGREISEPRPWVEAGQDWIVFGRQSSEPDGQSTGSQYLVRPDGTGEHRLVNEVVGSELRAAWSPDGRQLAYIQEARSPEDPAKGGVWLINADGTFPRQLLGCAAPCIAIDYLDWAPDGRALYFGLASGPLDADAIPTVHEIWRYDLVASDAGPVLTRTGDSMTVEQPKVSPDGSRVVYLRQRYDDPTLPSAIFIADLVGGPERRLTDWDLYAAHPDWSVDDLIVFNTFDLRLYDADAFPGARDLYTIRLDGSGLRRLTNNEIGGVRSGQPRWTPDGSGITYTEWSGNVSRLAFIAADGSGQRSLTTTGTTGGEPELRP